METEIVKQVSNLARMVFFATFCIVPLLWRLDEEDGGWFVAVCQLLMGLSGLLGMFICFLAAR